MPRRKVLSGEDLASLLALPTSEEDLTRRWTLGDDDIALIKQRRGEENRLGFGMQLCACRYPGRLLRPGEVIGHDTIAFVVEHGLSRPSHQRDGQERANGR